MSIQLHQCKTCKIRLFTEYSVLRIERFGPSGMYERNISGRINEYGREVRPDADSIPCPSCKTTMNRQMIQGRYTETPCDTRCTEAKGHKCECSCGGHNHGRAA